MTSMQPLRVWFYDACYLRFCSVDYDYCATASEALQPVVVQVEKPTVPSVDELVGRPRWRTMTQRRSRC